MFSFIRGIVRKLSTDEIILENNDIGYSIIVPSSTVSYLNIGESATINTYFVVREDRIELYGFLKEEELRMFKLLITVSKIGPKTAISILSTASVSHIANAISSEDSDLLSQIPGIGKKTAERIILELKGKMKDFNIIEQEAPKISENQELSEALKGLGYSDWEIREVVSKIDYKEGNLEENIKEALKLLYRKAGR